MMLLRGASKKIRIFKTSRNEAHPSSSNRELPHFVSVIVMKIGDLIKRPFETKFWKSNILSIFVTILTKIFSSFSYKNDNISLSNIYVNI